MAANFKFLREMKKVGQKVDRSEWFMTPETVNAYYAPFWNEMVFPAAILQPPFFHISHHPAQNFGAIGGIMGHELSHGFDTHGHKYDKSGRLKMWWRFAAARAEFLKRARCVVKYFQRYTVQGMQLSGLKELAENVADMGGVKFALSALRLFGPEEAAAGRTVPGDADARPRRRRAPLRRAALLPLVGADVVHEGESRHRALARVDRRALARADARQRPALAEQRLPEGVRLQESGRP